MEIQKTTIEGIPAILWGKPSDKIFIHVHGKMSRKEFAEMFAEIAEKKGYQTLSFDLPEHGERMDIEHRCDVWNGIRELNTIADYAFEGWKNVSLFGCSLGAYFALNTFAGTAEGAKHRNFKQCLFHSPIVDMEWLVKHMMLWSDVTEKQLEEAGEIDTPIDSLRWDYYRFILGHPVTEWPYPTKILYGRKDNLQPVESIQAFADRFGAEITISERSEHAFMEPEDFPIAAKWMEESICSNE